MINERLSIMVTLKHISVSQKLLNIAVFPYIYYAMKRFITLPREYVKDLATVGGSSAGFVVFVISLLWTHPGKPQADSDSDNLQEG